MTIELRPEAATEDAKKLICRLCQKPIGEDRMAFDPQGRGNSDSPRVLHERCLRAYLDARRRNLERATPALLALARRIAEALEGSRDPQEQTWWKQATEALRIVDAE